MVHIKEVLEENKKKLLAKKVRIVLMKALRHKWEARDNKHTVAMYVEGWTNEVMDAVQKLM